MKNKFYLVLIILTTVSATIWGIIAIAPLSSNAAEPMVRKIIVFKPGALNEPAKEALIAKFGGVKIKNLDLIGAKAVYLPLKAEAVLAQHSEVLRIDDDVIVEALVKGGIAAKLPPPQPAEQLPWGINRIDADLAWGITKGEPIKVAVVDTGIDVKHPDLTGNLKGGISTVNYTSSYNDDNGHGTHVAGIIGAVDNEIGVIGVGPEIDLYSVKVLNRQGSGYLSDIIEGLEWAIQNKMQVINMSLGTSSNVPSFREAVKKVNAAGIVQVAAAGNNGGTVLYPAAYDEVIAVSAVDKTDTIASWSSRGPQIDLAAPGVNIYSTYKGQTYQTLSGTSMAAPHIAGTAALVLTTTPVGVYNLDNDNTWDPIEVQNKLQAAAEDLGSAGYDNFYGYGLVDAERAVTQ